MRDIAIVSCAAVMIVSLNRYNCAIWNYKDEAMDEQFLYCDLIWRLRDADVTSFGIGTDWRCTCKQSGQLVAESVESAESRCTTDWWWHESVAFHPSEPMKILPGCWDSSYRGTLSPRSIDFCKAFPYAE